MSEHNHEWIQPEVDSTILDHNYLKIEITWFCKSNECEYIRKKKQVFDAEANFYEEKVAINDYEYWRDY